MVFWSTLLAFMIGVMYYVMYPGEGKVKDVYMPASEAFISSFLVQHQAAKTFAREAVIAIVQLTKFADDNSKTSAPESTGAPANSIIILTDSTTDKNMIGKFISITNTITETEEFKPTDDKNYVSVLACFDRPERKLNSSYVSAKLTDCKAATTEYVMTYGTVPMKDLDSPYTRDKTILWEHAILKRTHGSPDCGFLYYNGGNVNGKNQYFIHNSRRLTRNIPTEFTALLEKGNYLQNPGSSGRAYIGDSETGSDVLFCMTPINDPYPRLGLQVLLDSKVNSPKDTPTFDITHNSDITDNWINLAGTSNSSVSINSSGKSDWFFSRCDSATNDANNDLSLEYCQEAENKNAFTFTTDRYFNVTPSGTDNKTFLGSSFTISAMLSFSGNGTIFENRKDGNTPASCIPTINTIGGITYQRPCIEVKYDGGAEDGALVITVTGFKPDYTTPIVSTLSSGKIVNNVPTQIDYIFDGTGHRLYVNGNLSDSQSFKGAILNIEGLAGNNLTFGGSGNSSQLYNLAIYNRSGMSDTTLDGKFDMYGLPRIFKSNTMRYKNN